VVSRLMLSRPDAAMKYTHNGRLVYQSPGDGQLSTVLAVLYGIDKEQWLIPVKGEEGPISLWGYVGHPDLARGNRNRQTVILNGRYIRCYAIAYAVEACYDTRLTAGKYPFFVLHMRLPERDVDVNVHPSKLEVRLRTSSRCGNGCANGSAKPFIGRMTGL
jgi:DNA mismatch repair protein MutL